MSDRSLKKSLSEKTNRPVVGDADENLDLFSVNRGGGLTSLDDHILVKPGRHSFEQAKVVKPEVNDVNDPLCTGFEVPLGTLSRLVLEARNVTLKLQAISTTKDGLKSESDPSSKPTRSNSAIRPSNIPTLRGSNIGPAFPTVRSSSAPKKTTSASASVSVSSPKRSVSRSLTPVSRKTPSRSSTPSRISTTTISFKKAGEAQRSRSLTPRSKSANSTPPSSRTNVRSASASSRPSVTSTPPKLKERVALAFGRPVVTTTNVNPAKRNTSPDVTRTRPKGASSSSSLIPTFSGASHSTESQKSVKSSAKVADSTRSGKKSPKTSVQVANNHPLDVSRNEKMSTNPFLGTMLYPHSIRTSSTAIRKRFGSSGSSDSSNNQEEEEGKSLTKEGNENTEKNDSARYDDLLNVKDVKDTNWLLNLDDESNYSLIFDNAFDSPPEPFSPL